MQVLEKLKIVQKGKNKATFKILILTLKTSKNSFNGKILGRTLEEWVAFSAQGHDINIVDYDNKKNMLEFVKERLDKRYDYTIVLTSTIPLITSTTISNIKEYCTYKNINVCKLPVGYVISNAASQMAVDSVYSQNLEDFYIVENKKQFTYALSVLQDRINSFHIENGVDIVDPKKVYIEPDVDISRDVTIYPGNSLKGNTKIYDNVILKENNVIENSKIGKESCVSGSVITGSVLGNCVCISPFCEIDNSLIGSDVIVGKGTTIKNYKVNNKESISPNSILGEDK